MSSSGEKLLYVPGNCVMAYWSFAEGFLRQACIKGPGDYSPELLREMCESGQSQLWISRDERGTAIASAVTTISIDYKTGARILEWTACAGESMAALDECHDTIVAMAREEKNCVSARATCRLGLGKKLQKRGYRVIGYVMERVF